MFNFLDFFKQKVIVLLLLSLSYSPVVLAQVLPQQFAHNMDSLARKLPQQLVYLQTSKGVYEIGEELWFKAYLMDSQFLTPSLQDSTLYIQLLKTDNHQVIVQEKILINKGFANGHLFIPDSIAPGNYLLAAFTPHSFLKDGQEFKAFRKLSILKRIASDSELKTTIKQLGVSNKSDSLLKTKLTEQKSPVLHFFPEGGNLVSGLSNTLAFKANERNGKPTEISGELLEDGEPVVHFKSTHEGMGKFAFTPKLGKQYQVKIEGIDTFFSLPEIYTNGTVMTLVRQNEKTATFLVRQTQLSGNKKVYISARERGKIYAMYQSEIKNDSLIFTLPADKFPQGIIVITLYNEVMEPLVERLVYMNLDQNLKIDIKLDQDVYDKKEKIKLHIKTTDEKGQPVIAHLGLSVYEALYASQTDFLNILSFAHLYSQIKGTITNPDYYFNQKNENRLAALDLLLLTQGWRKYVWHSDKLKITPESQLLLTNHISGKINSKKTVLPIMLIVVTPEQSKVDGLIPVSFGGDFSIDVADMKAAEKGYLYVKPLGDEETVNGAIVKLDDPFNIINVTMKERVVTPPSFFKPLLSDTLTVLPKIPGLINLNEVVIKGMGSGNTTYRDRYLRSLDSIAKYSFSNDYVGQCNWINCASCGSGTKPIEGVRYARFKDASRHPMHNVAFTVDQITKEPYAYPKYTEAQLMAKFNISKVEGYQPFKVFYEPNYEDNVAERNLLDFRNTLIWKPEIITNEKGEAQIEFYGSDIKAKFIGNIEGMNGTGLLGQTKFSFIITDKQVK